MQESLVSPEMPLESTTGRADAISMDVVKRDSAGILLCTEDHNAISHKIEQAAADVARNAAQDQLVEEAEDETPQRSAGAANAAEKRVEDSSNKKQQESANATWKTFPRTCHQVLRVAKEHGDPGLWDFQSKASSGPGACLQRVCKLMLPMKQFCQGIRVREGILSQAQVVSESVSKLSEHNFLTHQLALARSNAAFSGTKQGRISGWIQTQAAFCDSAALLIAPDAKDAVRLHVVLPCLKSCECVPMFSCSVAALLHICC